MFRDLVEAIHAHPIESSLVSVWLMVFACILTHCVVTVVDAIKGPRVFLPKQDA